MAGLAIGGNKWLGNIRLICVITTILLATFIPPPEGMHGLLIVKTGTKRKRKEMIQYHAKIADILTPNAIYALGNITSLASLLIGGEYVLFTYPHT